MTHFSHFSPFLRIFPLFLRIFPLFLRFSLLLPQDKGKQQQFTAKMGNFTPTPSAPTPCKTSRTRNRMRFPSGNEMFGLWPQTLSQIATGLNPLRLENRKPNPPLYLWSFKSQPAGRNRRIWAAKAAANRRIAGHKVTKAAKRGRQRGRLDYICISKTNKSVSVIFWKLI